MELQKAIPWYTTPELRSIFIVGTQVEVALTINSLGEDEYILDVNQRILACEIRQNASHTAHFLDACIHAV